MNTNVGIQNTGVIAWDGTTAFPRDIRRHVRFGFSFEVVTALTQDTVFNVLAHDPSEANDCLPGASRPVAEVPTCVGPLVPAAQATFVLPAGTPAGTICAGTIPCYPGAFVSLAAASGQTAQVKAVMILQGPRNT